MINVKNSLTNVNYCDIIYSQTEDAPLEYFLGGTEMVKSNVESVIKKSSFLMVFAEIMRYGKLLQKESDETL